MHVALFVESLVVCSIQHGIKLRAKTVPLSFFFAHAFLKNKQKSCARAPLVCLQAARDPASEARYGPTAVEQPELHLAVWRAPLPAVQ